MVRILLLTLLLCYTSIYAQPIQLRAGLQAVTDGDNKMKVNDWRGALNDYTTAITVDPDFADAYYKRSVVLTKLEGLTKR